MMRSAPPTTCAYGLPGQRSYLFERARQTSLARNCGITKRKLHDDYDEYEAPLGRMVVDAFGNRVLVDGLKRMRVSSPPTVPEPKDDDEMMDDSSSDSDSVIVPIRSATIKTPTLVEPAKKAMQQFAAVPTALHASDPSCRAMVLFDPHQTLPIERSPRIQLVGESESDDSDVEEPFVRFEELPDDYEEEPEAMDIDDSL